MTPSEKLTLVSQNEEKVFNSGKNVGYSEGFNVGYDEGHTDGFDDGHAQGSAEGWQQGLDEGITIGKKSQYDEFWDAFQQNGTRENYENGFAGKGWYKENLTPKYDITPSFASNIFLNCPYEGDLRDLPVKLDFSKSQSISNMFGYFYGLTGVGVINTTSSPTCTAVFINARALITIEKFILKADGSQTFSNCFTQCYKLQNIVIDGVIGQDISFQHSTELSKDSITSIINALKVDANGKTLTLSKTAKKNAFTTDEWDALVAKRSKWTISLV